MINGDALLTGQNFEVEKAALASADRLVALAREGVRGRITGAQSAEAAQHAAHGLAWLATAVEALRQLLRWAERLQSEGRFGATERLILTIGFGEFLADITGGIRMSQGETIRLAQLGISAEEIARFANGPAARLVEIGTGAGPFAELANLIAVAEPSDPVGDPGLDPTLLDFAREMRRFSAAEVEPFAHRWHLDNAYIPLDAIAKMGALGVFGLTIPERFGGLGLGKTAMCVVSEELSRGYIGVGSLGTRSEIAAELILSGGTPNQQRRFLPGLASGDILPTAVFTEPDTGSDLASLKTRAVRDGDHYLITGQKTWITHAARADVMTLLARTNPDEKGYKGLSMFLAEKPRGSDAQPFNAPGLKGSEIGVLGYRGMKEFELSFDGFQVPAENLLGEAEGQGFKQLMRTFESARIQTAARAIGVARSAFDLALAYAKDRRQFGKPLITFPRVANKLVMMAIEIMLARQLTLYAAGEKDQGRRCDLEAGMAKLLAARVAWAAADNAVQIHGGNGFALEYPVSRVLLDARILSIFEGAAEIQAEVIARRLLDGSN